MAFVGVSGGVIALELAADRSERTFDHSGAIRVLHVIKALGRGGAEVLLREGFPVADRSRVALEYVSLRDKPADLADELRSAGATVHELGLRSDASLVFAPSRLARIIRERSIDVVHAHLPLAAAVARVAGRRVGVPVVCTEHAMSERYRTPTRLANRLTWPLQELAICITHDVEASVVRHYGTRVPLEIVRNGVNTDWFSPTAVLGLTPEPLPKLRDDDFVVGTVASFRDTPAKRLDLWIDAVASVMREHEHVRALLVGDGELRGRLEEHARATGMGSRFLFAGKHADVRPFLARMNVFVMSSAYEGLPVALVEAMSMGIPVVATEVSGVREVVRHQYSGYLVPFDDQVVVRLSASVGRVVADTDMAMVLGRQAREHVQEHLSMERMQRKLEEIYMKVRATRGAQLL